jgi:2-oxoglutarate dehydrogenase complex dehydrogenase (E1) component-like enzyme
VGRAGQTSGGPIAHIPLGKTVSPNVFDTYNAAYVQAMFDQYLQNPGSVDATWRRLFESDAGTHGLMGAAAAAPSSNGSAAAPAAVATASPVSSPSTTAGATASTGATIEQLRAARAAGELVDAYRLHGHRAARTDPLGSTPPGHPALDPAFHGITEAALRDVPLEIMDGLRSPERRSRMRSSS